jgi:hypothetical protein
LKLLATPNSCYLILKDIALCLGFTPEWSHENFNSILSAKTLLSKQGQIYRFQKIGCDISLSEVTTHNTIVLLLVRT